MSIQLCTLDKILPLTVKLLGVADGNFPSGSQVAQGAPYTLLQVKQLIFQADYEIALLIANNLEHPLRGQYATEDTSFLADGALIPPAPVVHTKVTAKYQTATQLGEERDYSRIKRIKDNPGVYGSPKFLYAIFGGHIHFSNPATTGKLTRPVVTKDETLTNLISPLPYFWAVIAGAITHAAGLGFNETHRRYWANLWLMYANEIKGGAVSLPEPEQLERLGT